MNVEGYSNQILVEKLSSVKQAIELVRRSVLTQMDGRDLARCRAMELLHKMDAYTVSQESGAQYNPSKHLQANFNRANFCLTLKQKFQGPRFRQVILDYFWIPGGTWMSSHWSKSFFSVTLPNFVKLGLLEYEPPGTKSTLGYGVVYLPFCLHCIKELIASLRILKGYYKISFLYKWELQENALWSGTSTIHPEEMQHHLGKNIHQEEIYCRLSPRDVFEAMEDAHITKHDILKVLRGIEDFDDVRMIRLTPLAQHNPTQQHVGLLEEGGFVGLLPLKKLFRGFDSLLPTKLVEMEDLTEEEESDDDEEEEMLKLPKKIVRRRKKRVSSSPSLKKRMYTIVPDMATYCDLAQEGKEKLTARYELTQTKRFRRACDIETFHLMKYRPARLDLAEDANNSTVDFDSDKLAEILRGLGRPSVKKEVGNGKRGDKVDPDNLEWVMCEKCAKWRRLPPHISANSLPDVWDCTMNTWDRGSATCDAEEDETDEEGGDEGHVYEYFETRNGVAVKVSQEALKPDTRGLELLSKMSEMKPVDGSLVETNHASRETPIPDWKGLELLSRTSALELVSKNLVAADQSADVESVTSNASNMVSPSPEREESRAPIPCSTMQHSDESVIALAHCIAQCVGYSLIET
jgi:hypothetical protein